MKKKLIGLTFGLMMVAGLLIGSVLLKDDTVEVGDITYSMTWGWGDAIPTESGWQVTNDLGYTVTVEKGYLVSHSVQLIPCEYDGENAGLLRDIFGANTVEAGHGGDENDPSAILIPQIEDLAVVNSIEFGATTVPYQQYCTAHYLVARSDSLTTNMPDDIDMYGLSLYLEGTYQAANSDELVAFALQTSLANGKITDIRPSTDSEAVRLAIGDEANHIHVQRQLDTLFHGVNFATMDTDEQARTILWSLIRDTQVFVSER